MQLKIFSIFHCLSTYLSVYFTVKLFRYTDDSFSHNNGQNIFTDIKNLHNTKFKTEVEINNKLNFIYITINNNHKSFTFFIFR